MAELTHARLLECLGYDPQTGVFVRRLAASPAVKAGSVAGSPDNGYLRISIDWTPYKAHRLAWFYVHGVWPGGDIDHINGQRADNRIANLRDVPARVNSQNQRRAKSQNQSGFLGVMRNGKRWMAQIKPEGKRMYLGTYDTPEEAHAAYIAAKRVHHEGCSL